MLQRRKKKKEKESKKRKRAQKKARKKAREAAELILGIGSQVNLSQTDICFVICILKFDL